MAQVEAQPDVAFIEMTAYRDRLREKVNRLPFDRSVLSVDVKIARRQLSARRAEIATVRGRLIEQKRLKEESEQKNDGRAVRVDRRQDENYVCSSLTIVV